MLKAHILNDSVIYCNANMITYLENLMVYIASVLIVIKMEIRQFTSRSQSSTLISHVPVLIAHFSELIQPAYSQNPNPPIFPHRLGYNLSSYPVILPDQQRR